MAYRLDNHLRNTLLTGTILLFHISILYSQQEDYRIEQIPMTRELPGIKVSCALQDSEGFMWLGTLTGLYRYDGAEYKAFRHDPYDTNSIATDVVNGIRKIVRISYGLQLK